MLKFILTITLLILSFLSFAQNNPIIDKLLLELSNNTKEDTTKANTLLQLARAFYMSNPAKTLDFAQKAYQLSEKIYFKKGIADGYRFQAIAQYSTGNFKEAETSLKKALTTNEDIKNNTGIMACLSMLGTVNTVQNNYSTALSYYQKVIRLGEKTKDETTMGVTYTNMGVIYSELKNYELALKYFNDGLKINTKISSKVGIAGSLANVGNVYFQTKNYENALEYYQNALEKNIEIDNKLGIAREYGNVANVYSEKKNYSKALQNYTKALEINESIKNKKGISVSLQGIGKYYLENKEYQKALEYTKRANQLASEIKIQDVQKESFDNLSVIYEKIGKLDSAYYNYKKYIEVKENIDNETNRKQISRLEIQYEFDAKEQNYKTEQLIANEKLGQQKLILALNQANFAKSEKEKDLIRLNFLKTASELKTEKLEKFAKDKQLIIANKEVELGKKENEIKEISLKNNQKQKLYYLLGISLLSLIGGLLFYQSQARKKTNLKLQNLNTELEEANKTKAKFFAILSHDLRSPVSNLINFLHLQKEAPELLSPEIKQRNESKISESAENLLETMESMLLWSKSQMEHFEPKMKAINVSDLFDYLNKFFSNSEKIEFEFIDSAHLQLVTDDDYLKTIMQNLTNNAVKALSQTDNAKITWKAQQINHQIILSITDNGPGISVQQKELLFADTNTIGSKTGFGFHLVRDLAKAIDCKINLIENTSQGAEFQLVFKTKI